ncbi:hypothetical protein D5086_026417 [Populus alba]|uniref:Uncharacterized protein n=1 Tax=Populus alba TaxID=43335 RepID=A0ACC4B1T7_POPAL
MISQSKSIGMMRKRPTTQSSPSPSKEEKQRFSNSIRALRPRVYITDTSKFKTLVQELTGNGKGSSSSCISAPPEGRSPQAIQEAPFIGIEDQEHDHRESSLETTSVEGYVHNSFDLCKVFQTDHHQEGSQVHGYVADISAFGDHVSMPMDQQEDLLAYHDLESWLLSSEEPCSSSYNGYFAQTQQRVNIYDYTSYLG